MFDFVHYRSYYLVEISVFKVMSCINNSIQYAYILAFPHVLLQELL